MKKEKIITIIQLGPDPAPAPVKPDVKPETKPGEKKERKWGAPKPLVQPKPKA